MSMHTQEQWAQHATLNMTQAQQAQHQAGMQCDTSRRAHEGTVASNLGMYDQLHETMGQKVKNSQRLIEKLQGRADSIDSSLQQTRASLGGLEKALRDKDAPLQLCMWRLEQREKRPLREQVRDAVEVALEEEKATLVETQRRLGEAIRRTQAMITDLQRSFDDVRLDLDHKMQALSVDEMCMRTTKRSMHTVVERTPPPASARSMRSPTLKASGFQVALQESHKNEVMRQQDAERLNRTCLAREEGARVMREDNAKLGQRCETAAGDAVAKAEKRMQERVQEHQQMRRRLEGELHGTATKIEHTKNTLSETRYQMKALEEPMELTTACASWRQQRATKEHITDPVSTTLQEHRATVLQAHQELMGHHQSEKTHLKELQHRHGQLREDLQDKTASMHIDLNCLTHQALRTNGTSSAAVSDQRLSRALRMDRSFVPGTIPASAR